MTREEGREWYQSNHYDFAYNRLCFLDILKRLVECMLDLASTMEGNLARLKKGDMRIPIHRMELSRIRYMINSYLRIR
jgi:hypothetical protein